MGRTVAGNRHEINLERGIAGDMVKYRATCVCEKLNAPVRYFQYLAEQDGSDHMREFSRMGRPPKGGR